MSTPARNDANGSDSNDVQDKAKQAASDAVSKGQEKVDAAMSTAKEATGSAFENAQTVVGEAREQAAQLSSEAMQHVHTIADEASTQVREHAATQADRAVEGLKALAGQAKALAEGRVNDAGTATDYVQQASDKLSEIATRIETGGVDGVFDDVRTFARRRPGAFLLGAALVGFGAGRVLRGTKASADLPSARTATVTRPAMSPASRESIDCTASRQVLLWQVITDGQ